jgi:hypothetical protein
MARFEQDRIRLLEALHARRQAPKRDDNSEQAQHEPDLAGAQGLAIALLFSGLFWSALFLLIRHWPL